VEHFNLINQTFDSTMGNRTSILDDSSAPTKVPEMIKTTVAASAQDLPHAYAILAGSDADTVGHAVVVHSKEDEEKESLEGVWKLIQDLFRSDNAKVHAALDALFLDLDKDKKKCDKIQAVGGCFALVHLMQNCLDKAIAGIPACDGVTKLNELAELTTLHKTLCVIINLTFLHEESRVGITVVGGVEAVVKIMKTFPKCQKLQERAYGALRNLASCNIGATKAIRSGGIEVLLAAVTNHLKSAIVCETACWALFNIVNGSKENTHLLITLNCGAAVEKVRMKWLDNNDVQTQVRKLAKLFVTAWKARGDAEE
jgi:hypothetical protein